MEYATVVFLYVGRAPNGCSLSDNVFHHRDLNDGGMVADENRSALHTLADVRDITEGAVMTAPGIQVKTLKTLHPPVAESFSYRFNLAGKFIVFSGDQLFTRAGRFCARRRLPGTRGQVWASAEEMVKRRNAQNPERLKASILSRHTQAEDVGRIASAAKN